MSALKWNRHAQAERARKHGTEERDVGDKLPPVSAAPRVPAMSKEQLRREADRLLAGCSGPVERVPAGRRAIPEVVPDHQRGKLSREIGKISRVNATKMSTTGGQDSREVTTSKRKHGKPLRPKQDSLGTTSPRANRNAGKPGIRLKTPQQNKGLHARIETTIPNGLVIYCDGACEPNPGIGGWGFVVYQDGVKIHSDCGGADPTTNSIMEMTGALMALRWLEERSRDASLLRPVTARLLCDSQYVVNGCNDWRHGWKARGWKRKGKNPEIANLALWQELDEILSRVLIKLEWCKGHVGIIGNERADELSVEGRQAALDTPADGRRNALDQQLAYSI